VGRNEVVTFVVRRNSPIKILYLQGKCLSFWEITPFRSWSMGQNEKRESFMKNSVCLVSETVTEAVRWLNTCMSWTWFNMLFHDSESFSIYCTTGISANNSASRVTFFSHTIEKSKLKPGDHIYVYRKFGLYTHGIYVGRNEGEVIHFASDLKV